MNKKMRSKAQFDSLLVEEKHDTGNMNKKSVMNQKQIEWEVRKFYWNLYRKQEVVTLEILYSHSGQKCHPKKR